MGTTVENSQVGPHVSGGSFLGYGICLHRADADLDEWSPSCGYGKLKAAVNAARTGTAAELDAAGADAWGEWWTTHVVNAGRRAAIRMTLLNYLPSDLPMP